LTSSANRKEDTANEVEVEARHLNLKEKAGKHPRKNSVLRIRENEEEQKKENMYIKRITEKIKSFCCLKPRDQHLQNGTFNGN
jgi:hypothetical protein